jgi:predicted DNA-binding protein with PD1-like motif
MQSESAAEMELTSVSSDLQQLELLHCHLHTVFSSPVEVLLGLLILSHP